MKLFKRVEQAKALAEPLRMRAFLMLAEADRALSVGELVDTLREPQYAVSRTLRRLRQVDLANESRDGKIVYYALANAGAAHLAHTLASAVSDEAMEIDRDRLRWRLTLRENDRCVIPYTQGYNPEEYRGEAKRPRVLFVCVHNSARSQIAEEYLRRAAGDRFLVESAGLEPGSLNPDVVAILAEEGIDISGKTTRSVFDVYRAGHTYAYVITVCSREAEEKCPVFPGPMRRLSWPFPDPASFRGSREQRLARTREVARMIQNRIDDLLTQIEQKESEKTRRAI